MKRCIALLLLLVVAIMYASVRLRGQAMNAGISGTITDPSGAAVPGAEVTLTALGTRAQAKFISETDGSYSFQNLLTGAYELHVSAKGFKDYEQTGILVNINAKLRVDVKLELGSAVQTIEVSANASPLNFESPEQKGTISPETIDKLPLILAGHTRTAVAFARLLPGAVSGGDDDALNFNTRINGGTNEGDEAVWDGASIVDGSLGQNGIELAVTGHPMSPEAIQEITLLTSNYDAQFGSTSSAVTTAVTKSGTDQWHGSAYSLVRNTALNARQWGVANRPQDIETDFGGTLGGPIKIPWLAWSGRKKTYAFANYEGFRLRGAPRAGVYTMPTAKMRTGDFSEWPNPIYDPATTCGTVNPITGLPNPACITDAQGNITNLRQQFMGCDGHTPNVICPSDPRLANSLAKAWLDLTPLPNLPGSANGTRFNYTPPNPPTGTVNADSTVFDLRVDHYVADKDHFTVAVHYFGSFGNNQTILPKIIAAESFRQPNYDFANRASWDHTFRPNLLNNFTLGYNDILSVGVCADEGKGAAQMPQIPGVPSHAFESYLGFSSYYLGYGCNGDFETTRPAYIVNDRLTWVKGKHNLGFGAEYRALQDKEINHGNVSGSFIFSDLNTGLPGLGATTGSSMASFLLGYVASANEALITLGDQYIRQKYYAFYANDTWKLTPKLTLNLGLRWDISNPSREKRDRVSFVNPLVDNPSAPGYKGVINWAGNYAPGASLGAPYPETTNMRAFAPRVGFAYSITPTTVVRAGYGIFYQMVEYPGWTSGVSPGRQGFNSTFSVTSPDATGITPVFFLQDGMPPVPADQVPPFFTPDFANGKNPGLYRAFQTAKQPYMQQFNLTVEKQFTNNFYISVAGVGNKGTHLISQMIPLNYADPSYLSMQNQLNDVFTSDAPVDGINPPYPGWAQQLLRGGGCAPTVAQALTRYPQWCGTVANYNENAGHSSFYSLQVKAEKRYSHGLWLLTSYTWSKFMSTFADIQSNVYPNGVFNPEQRQRWYSLDNQDAPNSLAFTLVYDLPFGRGNRWVNQGGVLNHLVGGWQVTSIFRAVSGLPLFFYASNCEVPSQFFASCQPGIKPGFVPFAQPKGSFDPQKPLFNQAAFEDNGVMGFNIGQGSRTYNYRGFPFYSHNISLQKTTSITERVKFQFRAEFFNLWNWHFFSQGTTWGQGGAFVNDVSSPSFGMVTGAVTTPRNIQLGAKITF
jgi:hypothetical protein